MPFSSVAYVNKRTEYQHAPVPWHVSAMRLLLNFLFMCHGSTNMHGGVIKIFGSYKSVPIIISCYWLIFDSTLDKLKSKLICCAEWLIIRKLSKFDLSVFFFVHNFHVSWKLKKCKWWCFHLGNYVLDDAWKCVFGGQIALGKSENLKCEVKMKEAASKHMIICLFASHHIVSRHVANQATNWNLLWINSLNGSPNAYSVAKYAKTW